MRWIDIGTAATLCLFIAACNPAPSTSADAQGGKGEATTVVEGTRTGTPSGSVPPIAGNTEQMPAATGAAHDQSTRVSEDRDGIPADSVAIVKKVGVKNAGARKTDASGAGCAIHLRYAKAGPKIAHWQVAPCGEADADILTQAQLVELGQWDDLPPDVVSDIKRYNKGGFLWVEAGPTASIFILDGVMRLREVSVAD